MLKQSLIDSFTCIQTLSSIASKIHVKSHVRDREVCFCPCLFGIPICRASRILQHADFHAVPRNSPFAAEKCEIARFCYFSSGFSILPFIKQ